ncbi:MAG: hypothetical protein ACKO0M_04735 [Cyanobium sp.]
MSDTGEANRARERNGGKAPDSTDPNRRPPGAATVSQRWWEATAAERAGSLPLFEAAPAPGAAPPPPPPPPPLAGPSPSTVHPMDDEARAADAARIQRLEQELAAAREEAGALHEMLEDLPEIFEHKFRQRLHGILEQQQLLLADNRMLRDQLFALQPAPEQEGRRLLPPAPAMQESSGPPASEPLQRVLHGMRRLGRRLRTSRPGASDAAGAAGSDSDLSDRDDGRPTAA